MNTGSNKTYKFVVLFYLIFSIVLMTPPSLIFFLKNGNFFILRSINQLLIFKFDLFTILFLLISIIIIIMIDIIFIQNKDIFLKNDGKIIQLFGKKISIGKYFIVSLLGGFFEELFFRCYLFYLPKFFFHIDLDSRNVYFTIIIIISIIFGLFHISQGIHAFIFGFIVSILFFISIKVSNTIWYAIFFHFLFNFIQLSVISNYFRKKYSS